MKKKSKSKLSEKDVREIKRLLLSESIHFIAKKFGVSQSIISSIKNGTTWRNVSIDEQPDFIVVNFRALRDIRNEEDAIEYISNSRWKNGHKCPFCGYNKSYRLKTGRREWKCKKCHSKYSVRVGTIFENSRIPLYKWIEAIFLENYLHPSSHILARELEITQKSAWFLLQRIRNSGFIEGNKFIIEPNDFPIKEFAKGQIEPDFNTTKVCNNCNVRKNFSEFDTVREKVEDDKFYEYLSSHCKDCKKQRVENIEDDYLISQLRLKYPNLSRDQIKNNKELLDFQKVSILNYRLQKEIKNV